MKFAYRLSTSVLALTMMAGAAFAQGIEIKNADWWQNAGKQFDGVTLRGVTESTPASNYIADVLAPKFEDLTGIDVQIETTSWDQMYDKAIKDMEAKTGIYDMVYIEQDIIYAYLARNFLVDLTQSLKDHGDLKAPEYSEANFTSFADNFHGTNGDLYGMPMEAFIKVYLYRTDLFNDPDVQAAFKEKTGKDLKPAKTHEEYAEIAQFFTDYGKEKGMDLWGTTAQAHTGHPASWYEYFESVAPTFGVYNWGINADKNYAATVENGGSMNSPKAKKALTWWLSMRDIAPPESVQSTWTEVATTFAAGRAAQGLVYGENAAWIATDKDKSRVVGNVGVALPPLEPGVMEDAESGKGYIGYYDGGAFGLPVTSKNKDAALLFLQFLAPGRSAGRLGRSPARASPDLDLRHAEGEGRSTRSSAATTRCCATTASCSPGAPPYPFHAPGRRSDDADLLPDPDRQCRPRRRSRPDGGEDRGRAEVNLGYRK